MYMSISMCICNVFTEAANFLLNINFPLFPYKGTSILLKAAAHPAKNYFSNHPVQIGVANDT